MRDFEAELAGERCWDAELEAVYRTRGEPLADCILQNRAELVCLCQVIEAWGLRSYLEIGVWTGRLVSALDRLFGFERVAACDDGHAQRRLGLPLGLPEATRFLRGCSRSADFIRFRAELGLVDLVLIDGDHSWRGVRADFESQRTQPHRVLVFHDIQGGDPRTRGVARFWRELREGHKLEIVRPHPELGLASSRMGLGLWSAAPLPPPPW
jgi:hypothetical protein